MARCRMRNNYFSHDGNARRDSRILELRAEYGAEGYGIYFMLVEAMFESSDAALRIDRLKGLSMDLHVDEQKLSEFIYFCIDINLFELTENIFYSPSLRKRINMIDSKKKAQSEGGKKAMQKRYNDNLPQDNDLDNLLISSEKDAPKLLVSNLQATCNNESKVKEKKRKETKLNQTKLNTLNTGNTSILAQSDFLQNPSQPNDDVIECEIDYPVYVETTQGKIGVEQEFLDTLTKAYPSVNHESEFNKMSAWIAANPAKRKTPRGLKKFINNWFERSQNQGASNGNNAIKSARSDGKSKFTMADCYANLEKLSIEIPADGDADLLAQWGQRAKS